MASSSSQGRFAVQEGKHGVAFRTDLSNIGTGQSGSRLFGGAGTGGVNILDEERRLIDKVFSIVDKDNSGAVDMEELKEMFKLFGVDSHYLSSAITRIMTNADKDFNGMISPTEFYTLLSQKFEKGDDENDIRNVFNRMRKGRETTELLSVDDLYEVSQTLGENVKKEEIKDMIKMFDTAYQKRVDEWNIQRRKDPKAEKPHSPRGLSFDDFKQVMYTEL